MMGHSHAITGAAAWVALTATLPGTLGLIPLTATEIAAGAVVTAGAALLPDADHHNGTIAHSLPPVSTHVTRFVGKVSGGHRHATHSLLGILGATALAYGLSLIRIPMGVDTFQLGAWIITVLLVAFAAKSLRLIRGWKTAWAISTGAATVAAWAAPEQTWWLPLSVLIGTTIHIIGDALTVEGVPVLWPAHPKPAIETPMWKKNGYFAVPILGKAGSAREWVLITLITIYTGYVLTMTGFTAATDTLATLT